MAPLPRIDRYKVRLDLNLTSMYENKPRKMIYRMTFIIDNAVSNSSILCTGRAP